MRVFVISENNTSLMPTKPAKARKLLKDKQAKIINKNPFTIKLLKATGENKQTIKCGVDDGARHAGISLVLEKEKKKPLITLFIQRLVYRQFFTYVVWKSILFAIKGGLMGWNKLQRTGNVQQPVNEGNKKFVAGE